MATAHVMRSPSGGVRNIDEGEEAEWIVWKRKGGRKDGWKERKKERKKEGKKEGRKDGKKH